LALKAGSLVTGVKNTIIWGNHSSTQYPDVNHGTINGKPIRDVINDDVYLNTDFISRVQKRGAEIIAARKGSSVFSAANGAKDHLKSWYLGTPDGEFTSMGIVSDGNPYEIPDGLVYSFPVRCKGNFEYEVVSGLKIDEFSREKMKATTQELQEEKADAFA